MAVAFGFPRATLGVTAHVAGVDHQNSLLMSISD